MANNVCPRCGAAMQEDKHRRMDVFMCYFCGYVDDGSISKEEAKEIPENLPGTKTTNYTHLQTLNLNEAAMFIAKGLGLDPYAVADWLEE